MKNKVLVVLSTCPDPETARGLAANVVEDGLAACVNIVPGVTSVYRWEGQTEQSQECLLVIKTTSAGMAALRDRIAQRHPYELPEIVAVPVVDGLPAYLDWVTDSVSG